MSGGGKETPRQKMIGMMYLFLTAMLALNVSKEVLDSFVMVNDSLTSTVENFNEKNKGILDDFAGQASMNMEKVEKWYNLAKDTRKQADEIVKYLNKLKIEVVRTADGPEAPAFVVEDKKDESGKAVKDTVIVAELISSKDNQDVGAQILIGPADNGKGVDLRDKILSFKEFLLTNVDEKSVIVRTGIERNLHTDPPPAKDGIQLSWQSHYFGHMPLAAVITMLTKLQSDIRNAEADMLRYLYSQIGARDFKFNKLDPVVIPSGTYVLQGEKYQADVFIAAQDTTQQPSVYVGQYRVNDDGSYEMIGSYDSLKIVNGRGYYEGNTSGIGEREWGGLITLRAPDGSIRKYPFEQKYTVAKPAAIISASANKVFYYGVDNPLEVSVPGLRNDLVKPSATNASIVRKGNGYVLRPNKKGGKVKVSLSANVNGTSKFIGSNEFSVKEIPSPTPKLIPTGAKSGNISKAELSVAKGIRAELEGFIMENIKYEIVSFTVAALDGRFTIEEKVVGSQFNPKVKDMINKATRGQQISFTDIKAKGPDGVKDMSPLVFKVN